MSGVRFVNLYSRILKKPMAFSIYLPDNNTHTKLLPVLYYFHGRNGNELFIKQLDIQCKGINLSKRD